MCPVNDATAFRPVATPTIDPAWSVNELLRRYPATGHVLNEYGIDSCCGGADSLEDAARAANVDANVLLQAVGASAAAGGR